MPLPLQSALFFCDLIKSPENIDISIEDEPYELVSLSAETQFKKPCYCVILDHKHFTVIIAISSTRDINDIFTDVCASPENVSFFGVSGSAHKGFYSAAMEIFLRERKTLLSIARLFDYSITAVGHSLGGATATILAMLLKEYVAEPGVVDENENRAFQVFGIALGAPPALSAELSLMTLDFIETYVLEKDPVPYCWRLCRKISQLEEIKSSVKLIGGFVALLADMLLNAEYCLGGAVHCLKTEVGRTIETTSGEEYQKLPLPMNSVDFMEYIEEHKLTTYISKFDV